MATDGNDAHARGHEMVEELAIRYPAASVSFGYIGNLERWGDDRSWTFFSAIPGPNQQNRLSFGWGVKTDGVPAFVAGHDKRDEFGRTALDVQVRQAMIKAGMRTYMAEFEIMASDVDAALLCALMEADIAIAHVHDHREKRGAFGRPLTSGQDAAQLSGRSVGVEVKGDGLWLIGCTDQARDAVRSALAPVLRRPWFEDGVLQGPPAVQQFWTAIAKVDGKAAAAALAQWGARATLAFDPDLSRRARLQEMAAAKAGHFMARMRQDRREPPLIETVVEDFVDWDPIGVVMQRHDIPGDMAIDETSAQMLCRLVADYGDRLSPSERALLELGGHADPGSGSEAALADAQAVDAGPAPGM
jgi:hypothetical protein